MKINEDCACQVQNCGPYGSCTIFQVFWSYIIALFEKKKSYLLQIFPWHVQVQSSQTNHSCESDLFIESNDSFTNQTDPVLGFNSLT